MLDQTSLVVKHNALVPALTKLTLQELRVLAFCIAHLDSRHDTDFKEMRFDIQEIAGLFGIDARNAYREIRKVTKSIMRKPVEFADEEYDNISHWFGLLRYRKDGGEVVFKMNEELKPYLLQLRTHFTMYRVKDVYQFKSASTWHIYELLKSHAHTGKLSISLDEFKSHLGLSDKYPRFNGLREWVIVPAIEEISRLSDLLVEWDKIPSKGRTVTGLQFHIRKNKETMTSQERVRAAAKKVLGNPQALTNPSEITLRLMKEFKVNPRQAVALSLVWEHRQEELDKTLERIKRLHEDGKVLKLGAYTVKTLKQEAGQEQLSF